MEPCAVIIPALKKNVAFPDDLVKRIAGKPLLEHTLALAMKWRGGENVWVVTDSEEVELFCQRRGVNAIRHPGLTLSRFSTFSLARWSFRPLLRRYENWFILWPYTPTFAMNVLRDAFDYHVLHSSVITISVQEKRARLFHPCGRTPESLLDGHGETHWLEVKGFMIVKPRRFLREAQDVPLLPYPLHEPVCEIQNFTDWWVCEGMLQRKRIVFRVIGNPEVGMGHIFRALTLAHEISGHEVLFVCTREDEIAVNKITGQDYQVIVCESHHVVNELIGLNPDLVINDVLDTSLDEIHALKKAGVRVLNFEDLGSGAAAADVVVNELYDEPLISGDHIHWGAEYMFLREEFYSARVNEFKDRVERILVAFGGTDPSNLTINALNAILPVCREENIRVDVVVGEGYSRFEQLETLLAPHSIHSSLTNATGVISRFMEECQLAVCGNGRTVYELAHMHVPALVIAHHEREATHHFAHEGNGFINLGVFVPGVTDEIVEEQFKCLLHDRELRKRLWKATLPHDFIANKRKVLSLITRLLESE
ncbi:MAG: cytidine 5'-phosphate N-acetylneuraminic acid synthetase [bacterium]|nr:cytidine 5'-phosphate N-acetylneuraminic acid synthetase [bacterium]